MAITIEVSRGRYLRHLRDQAGINQRDLIKKVNAVLPPSEQKTHQWFAAVEVDRIGKISVPMAIALHHVLNANIEDLGVSSDEVAAHRRLLALLDEPPAVHEKRPRGRPRKKQAGSPGGQVREPCIEAADLHEGQMPRSACMARRRLILSGPACPTTAVHSLPFVPKHRMGSSCAHRQ